MNKSAMTENLIVCRKVIERYDNSVRASLSASMAANSQFVRVRQLGWEVSSEQNGCHALHGMSFAADHDGCQNV